MIETVPTHLADTGKTGGYFLVVENLMAGNMVDCVNVPSSSSTGSVSLPCHLASPPTEEAESSPLLNSRLAL